MYFSATQSNFEAFQYQTNGSQGRCGLPVNPTLPSMPCAPSPGNMNARANFFGQLMQAQQSLFSGWSNFCGCSSQQMPQGQSCGNSFSPQGQSWGNNSQGQSWGNNFSPQGQSWGNNFSPQGQSWGNNSQGQSYGNNFSPRGQSWGNCFPQMSCFPQMPQMPCFPPMPQMPCLPPMPQMSCFPQMPQQPTCFGNPAPQRPEHRCPPTEVHFHEHYYEAQPAAQPVAQPAPQPVAQPPIWRTEAPAPLTRSLPSTPPAATASSTPAAPAQAQTSRRGTFAAHAYGAFGPGSNAKAVFNTSYFNNAQGGQSLLMGRG